MKLCIILGTRPEIIKLTPIIRAAQKRNIPFFVIHTGQHFTYELDALFFEELGLSQPAYNLKIASRGSNFQGEHTGRMLIEIEQVLINEKPDVVFVQGDTNTVLAAAIAVRKLRTAPTYLSTMLCHVEAGLRSFDDTMTEELNRIVADQLSDFLFAPSPVAKSYLLREGIPEKRIFVTGNTIVDSVRQMQPQVDSSDVLKRLNLEKKQYIFATSHRQENVDSPERLKNIFIALGLVVSETGIPVVFSLHPRTAKTIQQFSIEVPESVQIIQPVGFLDSLTLQKNSLLVLTDSGGLQEEASILGVPCVTLRDKTERPETVTAGVNVLVGTDPELIVSQVKLMLNKPYEPQQLYGDGFSAEKMLDIVLAEVV